MDEEYVNPNFNKINQKTSSGAEIVDLSGIDQILDEMKLQGEDNHPEKRMKAAWTAFFERKLDEYKREYPNLKRSQYVQMIQKEFKTSMDNPVYAASIKKAEMQNKDGDGEEEDEK